MNSHKRIEVHDKKEEMNLSRRRFIGTASVLLAGTAINFKASGMTSIIENKPEPIIDIHQHIHYLSRKDDQLIEHQKAMGVTTSILLPAGRPVNSPSTHEGVSNGLQAEVGGNAETYLFVQGHKKHFRFGACAVPDLPDAIYDLEKYLKKGAVVIGEQKFGVECDSPEMQKIYQLAQEYDVPVLMHWQPKMYSYGIERFHTMLEKYPKVNFIGHAQGWWAHIDKNYADNGVMYPKGKVTPGGLIDRLLSDYPNIYGDCSAGSGNNGLTRDEDFTKEFLTRHQDKLLFGSDCTDSGSDPNKCVGVQTIGVIRKLAATKQIERKILYENAKKLFRI